MMYTLTTYSYQHDFLIKTFLTAIILIISTINIFCMIDTGIK